MPLSSKHSALARNEALPSPTEGGGHNLVAEYQRGLDAVGEITNPLERAIVFEAYVARGQLFYDGNKRQSRHLMNGELLSHGVRAISVPAQARQECNVAMVHLHARGDADRLSHLLNEVRRSQRKDTLN
jgi:hypothetical protein